MRAGEGAALREFVECRIFAARDADIPKPVADIHDLVEASVVARELGEEFLDRKA